MKAGHDTTTFVQCADRVDAAGEANVQLQLALTQCGGRRLLQGVLTQRAQGIIMAGIQGHHMDRVVKCMGETAFEFCAQGFNLGCQPGLGSPLGPHQFRAELAQASRLAFFPHQQLASQLGFPAFELTPNMAVRQTQSPCCGRNGALCVDRLQQINQRVAYQCRAAVAREGVVELKPMHDATYRRL